MWRFAVIITSISLQELFAGWTSWSQMGPCSVTCGAGEIWQQRSCIGDTPNPVCRGPQQRTSRCQKLACPVNDCNCGCVLKKKSGSIRSISPSNKSLLQCTWTIRTVTNTRIKLTVNNFVSEYGSLFVTSRKKVYLMVTKREKLPFTMIAQERELNVSLQYHKLNRKNTDAVLEATYEILGVARKVEKERTEEEEQMAFNINIPTTIGISACTLIIIVVLGLIIYRKMSNSTRNTDPSLFGESMGSSRPEAEQMRDKNNQSKKLVLDAKNEHQQRLVANYNNGSNFYPNTGSMSMSECNMPIRSGKML